MKLIRVALIAAVAAFPGVLMAGNDSCHHNCNPPQNPPGGSSANANQEQYQSTTSTSKSDSTALAGAYNRTAVDVSSNSTSGSLSGSQSNSSAKSGDSNSKAVSGDSYAKGGDASSGDSSSGASSSSGDSTSGSTAGSDVNINAFHEGDRYPDIPVNAGVVFAGICQEGSSATNSKISIALVTDSSFCNRLQMADSYRVMFQYYAKACNADHSVITANLRHKQLVASQVKGSVPIPSLMEEDGEEPINCDHAEEYRLMMGEELAKAQKMLDRTSFTGLIAKWSTQLGIPVSLMYVIVAVL